MKDESEKMVIMITSQAGEKHRTKALQLGASDYIVKPYQDETLWAAIQRLTRSQSVSQMRQIFSGIKSRAEAITNHLGIG